THSLTLADSLTIASITQHNTLTRRRKSRYTQTHRYTDLKHLGSEAQEHLQTAHSRVAHGQKNEHPRPRKALITSLAEQCQVHSLSLSECETVKLSETQ